MDEGAHGTLFASYTDGTWEYDSGGWHKMTSAIASRLAAVTDNYFYSSFSAGTYKYNGGWSQITTAVAGVMDASSGGTLYASYSTGTWRYNGSWTKLTTAVARDIAVASSS